MSLLVVGLSHRSAPLDVLEHVAVSCADTATVLHHLLQREHVTEALLLSTCNRVEIYAMVTTFHDGLAEITDILAHQCAMTLDHLSPHLCVRYATAGVAHLFSVAAGLDSMVIGEPQILGQLRTAYANATQTGTVGHTLHDVMQQALRVGKRVHTETHINTAGASIVSEALTATATALTGPHPPSLAGRRALVLGTGSLGALATTQLRKAGVAEIILANRTPHNAHRLATRCHTQATPTRVISLDALTTALPPMDLVICCTAATDTVLTTHHITNTSNHQHPLVICDLGLPRNVDPAVGDLPGVTLLDLTTIAHRLKQHGTQSDAVHNAQQLLAQELHNYQLTQRTAQVIPTVTALRQRATNVINTELQRLDSRLPELDPAIRTELTHTVHRVVDKLMHTPTTQIKQLAKTSAGQTYTHALRKLFELDPQTTAAITTPLHSASRTELPGLDGGTG